MTPPRLVIAKRHLLQWVALVGCGVGVFLVIHGEPIQDVMGAAAFVAVGLLIIAAPVDLLRRYASGGLEVEAFGLRAKLPAVPSEPREEDDAPARDLIELRFKLEQKMTFLAKHVLGTPQQPAYLTLGSMVHDGQMEAAKAEVCAAVSSLRVPTTRDLSDGESLNDWLVRAQRIISTLRVDVLSETTYSRLEEATADGERLFVVDRRAGVDDLPRAARVTLVQDASRELIVIPVFSQPPNGRIYERTAGRAERLGRPTLLVCPPRASLGAGDTWAGDAALRLPALVDEVARRLRPEAL